jgi:hypothetical protein
MAATPLHPRTPTTATGNAAGKATFLRLDKAVLARAEHVTRDYFGRTFPITNLVSRP